MKRKERTRIDLERIRSRSMHLRSRIRCVEMGEATLAQIQCIKDKIVELESTIQRRVEITLDCVSTYTADCEELRRLARLARLIRKYNQPRRVMERVMERLEGD